MYGSVRGFISGLAYFGHSPKPFGHCVNLSLTDVHEQIRGINFLI